MTALTEQEHQQRQPIQDAIGRSSTSNNSLATSSSSSIDITTITTAEVKPVSIAASDISTSTIMNENGKRSRPEYDEQPEGRDKQDEGHPGTASCSEKRSESSSSLASSLSSMQKVALLDGHATHAQQSTTYQYSPSQQETGTLNGTAVPSAAANSPVPGGGTNNNLNTGPASSHSLLKGPLTTPYHHHNAQAVPMHAGTVRQHPAATTSSVNTVSIVPIGGSTFVQQLPQHTLVHYPNSAVAAAPSAGAAVKQQQQSTSSKNNGSGGNGGMEKMLRPFPYFHYRDFSHVPDPDPLAPLTAPGRVPNFPAKMHSILSRQDLAHIVCWNDHGRAWRVLKPREFEVKVIPTYFEHAKFSSFIRQANGWGFRRITQGKDRNSYYHEMFLRGLPHLCKMMKRPGVSEKLAADPDQEPDFYLISEEHPLPERTEDESVLLQCTLQGGPKARMPIYFGALTASLAGGTQGRAGSGAQQPNHITPPPDNESQHQTVQLVHGQPVEGTVDAANYGHFMFPMPAAIGPVGTINTNGAVSVRVPHGSNIYHSQDQQQSSGESAVTVVDPSQPLSLPANANPHFAAGFAAAQKQFQALFGHAIARVPTNLQQIAPAPHSSGILQVAPQSSNQSQQQQQQQHFAPLYPGPHQQSHNQQVVIHPMIHGQQQQGQHFSAAVAQPFVQHIAYQPIHMTGVQHHQAHGQTTAADHWQPLPFTNMNQQAASAPTPAPCLTSQNTAAPSSPAVHFSHTHAPQTAPAPYDFGKHGQQQIDSQQQQQYYVAAAPTGSDAGAHQ